RVGIAHGLRLPLVQSLDTVAYSATCSLMYTPQLIPDSLRAALPRAVRRPEPGGRRSMSRRRIRLLRRLVGLTAVLLALLPSSALARPTWQLVSAKTMRAASGLSQVAAQSNDSSTECLLYAWAPSLHTSLPSRLPQTKFKAALKDGQIAIVRLLAEYAGPAGNRVTIELAT